MTFIKNCWYVVAWSSELDVARPVGRVVAGEPIVLYRTGDGAVVGFEDRCAHRRAPLSLGRVEGDDLRCMYHGLRYGRDGVCKEIPGSAKVPPNARVRAFPIIERDNWIWLWLGDPTKADINLVPPAFGPNGQDWKMKFGQLDYAANYMLISDNLCDASHVAYLHENTLGATLGQRWANEFPKVTRLERGVRVARWFTSQTVRAPWVRSPTGVVDIYSSYDYLVPGIFLLRMGLYEPGTGEKCKFEVPGAPAYMERIEQEAVTPLSEASSRYFFATGHNVSLDHPAALDSIFAVVTEAFEQDRVIIEAQQKVWDITPAGQPMVPTPHDKALIMMRGIVEKMVEQERGE